MRQYFSLFTVFVKTETKKNQNTWKFRDIMLKDFTRQNCKQIIYKS